MTGSGLLRLIVVPAAALLLWELHARIGAPVLRLFRFTGRDRMERFGVALLAGLALLGPAFLGLTLMGLCRGPEILATTVGLLLVSRGATRGRPLAASAAAEARARFGWRLLLPFAALAVPAIRWLLPETENDAWVYHLGLPWMQRHAGRLVVDRVPWPFHLPVPVEYAFNLPLALGDDRLAKWMVGGALIAGCAVVFARIRSAAGWLFPLLLLATPEIRTLLSSKNDLAAAAPLVAGALLAVEGASIGWLLLGAAAAAKVVYGPLIALLAIASLPRPGRWPHLAILLLLPILPWWVKNLALLGNPFFPFASEWFTTLDWGEANRATLLASVTSLWHPGTDRPATLLPALFGHLRSSHLPLLLLLPWMALGPSRRWLLAATVAGLIVLLGAGRQTRFLVPALMLAYVVMLESVDRLPRRIRTGATVILVLAALIQVAKVGAASGADLRLALATPAAIRDAQWTTLRPLLDELDRIGARRWQAAGEPRTFRFPGRPVYNGSLGETPAIWALARASRAPEDLRKRFRQQGTDRIMLNYVTAELVAARYGAFAWDDRMADLYVEFCRRYLRIAWRSAASDNSNGGFVLFDLLPAPLAAPPKTLWFAPGIEAVYGRGLRLASEGASTPAQREFMAAFDRLPDLGTSWNLVGHGFLLLNQPEPAWRFLRRFAEEGMMDSINLAEYAVVATWVAELGTARQALDDAVAKYPDRRPLLVMHQAMWRVRAADLAGSRHDAAAMSDHLGAGLALLDGLDPAADPEHEPLRLDVYAQLLGLSGDLRASSRDLRGAREMYARALALSPGAPRAAHWRRSLDGLAGSGDVR